MTPAETHVALLLERATRAQSQAQHQRALGICALGLNRIPPVDVEIDLRTVRARSYEALGNFRDAAIEIEQAARRAPEHAPYLQEPLGRYRLRAGDYRSSVEPLHAAARLNPHSAEVAAMLGDALTGCGRHEEARAAYDCAVRLSPGTVAFRVSFARALHRIGEAQRAESVLQAVLDEAPSDVDALVALAVARYTLGATELAAAAAQRAVSLAPTRADAQMSLAESLLRLGRYCVGFRAYDWRLPGAGLKRKFGLPPWKGESLSGRTLVIWAEQGHGDILQFVRYVRPAQRTGARTVLVAPRRLLRLLRTCAGIDELAEQGPRSPPGDRHAMLMSLPHLLGLEVPPASETGYLTAETELLDRWKERIAEEISRMPRGRRPRLSVAIAWQGNPDCMGDSDRSIPLGHLVALLRARVDDCIFLSVQKNFGHEQLASLPQDLHVVDLDPGLDARGDAFIDTAAVCSAVDLVITSDTSIAHLAGALGARVWVLLPARAEWRWGVSGTTTAWYPRMRLYRQPKAWDWEAAVAQVSGDLASLAASSGWSIRGNARVSV